ncbi:MAG: hypothetical protein Q8R91_03810 [Candidatus Omnitrophota bacterium]|jgi:hypothetical protein|nr:hypothetical protein [Candidatus Omnitrophota bacterium]
MTKKPRVKLVGTDGNIFAVVGRCKQALQDAGQSHEAKELVQRVFKATSYDEALGICQEYIEAE